MPSPFSYRERYRSFIYRSTSVYFDYLSVPAQRHLARLPEAITHEARLVDAEAPVDAFLECWCVFDNTAAFAALDNALALRAIMLPGGAG